MDFLEGWEADLWRRWNTITRKETGYRARRTWSEGREIGGDECVGRETALTALSNR